MERCDRWYAKAVAQGLGNRADVARPCRPYDRLALYLVTNVEEARQPVRRQLVDDAIVVGQVPQTDLLQTHDLRQYVLGRRHFPVVEPRQCQMLHLHVGVRLLLRQLDTPRHVDLVRQIQTVLLADAVRVGLKLFSQFVQPAETDDVVKRMASQGTALDNGIPPLKSIVASKAENAGVQEFHLAVQIHGAFRDGGSRQNAPHYRPTAHGTDRLGALGLSVLYRGGLVYNH